MMSSNVRTIAGMTLLLLALAGKPGLAAQEAPCAQPRDVRAGSLEAYTWNRLDAIYREISAENYDAAYADLQKLLDRSGSDPYLQAIVYQALAYIEGLSDDPGAALEFLQSAIELDALPDAAHYALVFQAAQLQYGRQHYDEASRLLDAWFCASPGDVPATAYALRASLYLQEPDYAGALEAVDEAIRLEHDPPGSWYRLKVAALYELERYPEAAETLEAMIARWPGEKEFWVQLSQIQYRLKNTDRSLAVAALAYRNGLLDRQGDILYLSGLYREAGNPYRSAEVLEAGVRAGIVESSPYHWTRIAETWLEANETGRSLSAWREAAALSPDGSADLRRGFILVDQERWTAALEALDLALEKGGLDAGGTGNGYLLRGISRFELGDYDAAEADWSEAEHYDGVDQAARQWMDHLRTVRRRAVS